MLAASVLIARTFIFNIFLAVYIFLIRVSSHMWVQLFAYTYSCIFTCKNCNARVVVLATGAFQSNISLVILIFSILIAEPVVAGVSDWFYIFVFKFCISAYQSCNAKPAIQVTSMTTALVFWFNISLAVFAFLIVDV